MRYQVVGIDPGWDYLYDPQQAAPIGFCPVCGEEIYPGNETGLCRQCLEYPGHVDSDSTND